MSTAHSTAVQQYNSAEQVWRPRKPQSKLVMSSIPTISMVCARKTLHSRVPRLLGLQQELRSCP